MRLRRLIGAFRPDVVHAHMPPAELYARIALFGSSRTPLVITKHNDEPFHPYPAATTLGSWVIARATRVIAISEAVARYTAGQLSIDPSRLRTVHYGIDSEPYRSVRSDEAVALRRALGVGDHELLIGTVGRLVAQKNFTLLLNAFAKLARPARLMIVGDGVLGEVLRSQADDLGIGDRVVFTGFRDDIPPLMAAFDVFALSSSYEGFGLVLLEAMAACRPVVATNVSAVPEVVVEGETGFLVQSDDADAFAAALAKLHDAETRRRFGAAGLARVQRRFTMTSVVDQTSAVYDELS